MTVFSDVYVTCPMLAVKISWSVVDLRATHCDCLISRIPAVLLSLIGQKGPLEFDCPFAARLVSFKSKYLAGVKLI